LATPQQRGRNVPRRGARFNVHFACWKACDDGAGPAMSSAVGV